MLNNKYKISICIPTFEGESTLGQTLDSICTQITPEFEVIISDDHSLDRTLIIASEYAIKYSNIKAFKNEDNLGMDKNFHQCVKYAKGEYIWFCGQDDIFMDGALAKILEILDNHSNLGIIYLNFTEYDHDLSKCITPSGFALSGFNVDPNENGKEIIVKSSSEYFEMFNAPPTFLPAIIMLRDYWDDPRVDMFYGTNYVQTGLILLYMDKRFICVLPKLYIKGRIPSDKWQTNGKQLFYIMTGYLKVNVNAFKLANNTLPIQTLKKIKLKYLLWLPNLAYKCNELGFRVGKEELKYLENIFANKFLISLYLKSLLLMPIFIYSFPIKLLKFIINEIKRFIKETL